MYTPVITAYLTRSQLMRFTPRAALIDMDGTLYDSMPRHAHAWQQMMAEIGIDIPYEEFFLHEGRTGAATIDLLFRRAFQRPATERECRQLYLRKTQIFASMPPVDPMPGAAQFLETLRSSGILCVLVTGSGQSTLLDRLDTDFPGVFEPHLRVTSRDVVHGKPNPEPFLRAMQKAEVGPAEAIAIENAPLGIQAAHASGAFTIGVNTGPIPRNLLTEAGADITFPTMPLFAQALPMLIYSMLTTQNNFN